MASLGVGFGRGCNGMKSKIEQAMLAGIYDNGLDCGEDVTR